MMPLQRQCSLPSTPPEMSNGPGFICRAAIAPRSMRAGRGSPGTHLPLPRGRLPRGCPAAQPGPGCLRCCRPPRLPAPRPHSAMRVSVPLNSSVRLNSTGFLCASQFPWISPHRDCRGDCRGDCSGCIRTVRQLLIDNLQRCHPSPALSHDRMQERTSVITCVPEAELLGAAWAVVV